MPQPFPKPPLYREGMLPDFIIEKIRQREQVQRQEQPRLDLPVPYLPPPKPREDKDEKDRGVIVIDLV